jgi:hypothetical protein
MQEAHVLSREHETVLVVNLTSQIERFLPVDQRVIVLPLQVLDVADIVLTLCDEALVAEIPPDAERLLI